MLTSFSSLVTIVIKGLMTWGSKCHENNSPVVCDGYVKYDEAEVDRLVAILKTNNCGKQTVSGCLITAAAAVRVEYSKHTTSRGLLNYMLTRKYCEILENGCRVGSAKILVTVHDCSKMLCPVKK